MNLSEALKKTYTHERLNARTAQRLAQFIAFGPIVFQASRLLVKFGILEALRDSEDGLTFKQTAQKTNISDYAAKVLLEAGLSIGLVIVNDQTDKFYISKTGWFLINDPAATVNMEFNHFVNYEGFYKLEESLRDGVPAGLEHFGNWPTIYEGLSSLPEEVQKSWFDFDHFYSDSSFDEALKVVFDFAPSRILDVGGNTGRWAVRCVQHNPNVKVTILDLPQQLALMREKTVGADGSDRIDGVPVNLLDPKSKFPDEPSYDIIWMSQFLDCFSEAEAGNILAMAAEVMRPKSRLLIMETLWDRQRFEPASFCLTMTSLYFSAMANGNSKMYHSDDLRAIILNNGLEVERIIDNLGQGHSVIICKTK